jgi:hypothetical protein
MTKENPGKIISSKKRDHRKDPGPDPRSPEEGDIDLMRGKERLRKEGVDVKTIIAVRSQLHDAERRIGPAWEKR